MQSGRGCMLEYQAHVAASVAQAAQPQTHPDRKTRITHEQARTAVQHFANRHFNNPGEKSRATIPAHQDDDDILLMDYITQQEFTSAQPQEVPAEQREENREEKAYRLVVESGKQIHSSDCATSIAPAEEPGPCDCDEPQPPEVPAEQPCPVCGCEVRHPSTGLLSCECPAPLAQPASAAKPHISKLDEHRHVCEQCWTNAETGYLELCAVGEKIRLDETAAKPATPDYKPAWDEINRVRDTADKLLGTEYLGWNWVHALVDKLEKIEEKK